MLLWLRENYWDWYLTGRDGPLFVSTKNALRALGLSGFTRQILAVKTEKPHALGLFCVFGPVKRRRADLNRRMRVLQTLALPLGDVAAVNRHLAHRLSLLLPAIGDGHLHAVA